MASLSAISLPHGSIPTQMFGNVNLQNAVMYVNENFAALKDGVNGAISSANESLDAKADADHDHDSSYAALEHTHGIDAITGLNAALDDKAALNHEHSQYLTQLPAHNHDVAGIIGLQSALDARAEKVHAHDITDVNGLDSRLGTMASAAYVDQQIAQLGSSIKTIADEEVRNAAAAKEGSGGGESAHVPKDVVAAPQDETTEQKNARVGTSSSWARADHKHVFSAEMGENPTDNTHLCEDAESEPSSIPFVDWTAGGANGIKIRLYALVSEYVGGTHVFQPIDFEISSSGLTKSIKSPAGDHGIHIVA